MSPCIDLTSEQRYIFCTTPSHPNTIQTSLAQALCSGPLGLGYCNAFLCVRLHNAVGGIQPPRAPSCSISLCENVVVETWCALAQAVRSCVRLFRCVCVYREIRWRGCRSCARPAEADSAVGRRLARKICGSTTLR